MAVLSLGENNLYSSFLHYCRYADFFLFSVKPPFPFAICAQPCRLHAILPSDTKDCRLLLYGIRLKLVTEADTKACSVWRQDDTLTTRFILSAVKAYTSTKRTNSQIGAGKDRRVTSEVSESYDSGTCGRYHGSFKINGRVSVYLLALL